MHIKFTDIILHRSDNFAGEKEMASSLLPSFSMNLSFLFAFSLSFSSPQNSHFVPKISSPPSSSLSASPNLASDIVSLLGGEKESSKIPLAEANEIRSCLRFLVKENNQERSGKIRKILERSRREFLVEEENVFDDDDKKVSWPPAPVMELARLAIDSRSNPAVIQRSLDPTVLKVPDVEGLVKDKCQLTRTPTAYRFAIKELNIYFEFLFQMISDRAPSVGFNVSLNRYDLFHGHIFLASSGGRLGILFHAKEYPAYDKKLFPHNMGYCHKGSNVVYDDSINLRNILWLAPLPCNVDKSWAAPGNIFDLILQFCRSNFFSLNFTPKRVAHLEKMMPRERDLGGVGCSPRRNNI